MFRKHQSAPQRDATHTSAGVLPDEILVYIFLEAHMLYNNALDAPRRSYRQLYNHTLVCRRWLSAGRKALYKNLEIKDTAQAMLVFDDLRKFSTSLQLGNLVECINLHDLPGASLQSVKVWRRLLGSAPNVSAISVDIGHCQSLSTHPVWQNIRRLCISETRNGKSSEEQDIKDDFPRTDHFPPRLKDLTIVGRTSLLSGHWPDLCFEKIECLRLDNLVDSRKYGNIYRRKNTVPSRILPSMPLLHTLEVIRPAEQWESLLEKKIIKVIAEIGLQLRHLRLLEVENTVSFLSASLMEHLESLESLSYVGVVPNDLNKLRNVFPASLRQMSITWMGASHFGLDMLKLLKDPTFLPELVNYPELNLSLRVMLPLQRPTAEEITRLVRRAMKTHQDIKISRPNLAIVTNLTLPKVRDELIPLLPLPVAFRTSITAPLAEMLDDYVNFGRIVTSE